ncbi:MAG: VacJ family lipoprotein [Pseudomonadota bacterium]
MWNSMRRAWTQRRSMRPVMAPVFFVLAVMSAIAPRASAAVEDPLEPLNRPIFAVNNTFDRFALRPVAKGYDLVMPDPAQRSVSNFFANLYDVTSALNAMLQWRWEGALRNSGRVLVNSTIGVVGLFDVASSMGMSVYRTDFGQTLSIWGVPEGPYIMLPLFGPRTVRSGAGTLVDTFTLSVPPQLSNRSLRNTLWATELVHGRARLLGTDELITGDRYIFVRDAYLQQRSILVNDGKVVDEFSDFEEPWDDEF